MSASAVFFVAATSVNAKPIKKPQVVNNMLLTQYFPYPESWADGEKVGVPGLETKHRIDWLYSAAGVSMEGDGIGLNGQRYHISELGQGGWVNARGRRTIATAKGWSNGRPVWRNGGFWRNAKGAVTYRKANGKWSNGKGKKMVQIPLGIEFSKGPSRDLTFYKSIAVDPNLIPMGSMVFIPAYRGVGGSNGWFRADDVGGAIINRHIDVYIRPPRYKSSGTSMENERVLVVPPGTQVPSWFDPDKFASTQQQQNSQRDLAPFRSNTQLGFQPNEVSLVTKNIKLIKALPKPILVRDTDDADDSLDSVSESSIDVRAARFGQNARSLDLRLTLRGVNSLEDLLPSQGALVCVFGNTQKKPIVRHRWCLAGKSPKTLFVSHALLDAELRASKHRKVPAAIGLHQGALKVSMPIESSEAGYGRLTWHVEVWSRRAEDCATDLTLCMDRVPTIDRASSRTYRPRVVGCSARSPWQVTDRHGIRRKEIALTFDDGPGPITPKLLTLLKKEQVRATFFLVGSQIGYSPQSLLRAVQDGHELGNHSYSHSSLASGSGSAASQLKQTNRRIREVTSFTPCLYRPPYGATSGSLVALGKSMGMTSVLWDIDTNDWQLPGSSVISSRVVSGARPGSIALMHDAGGNRSGTLSAVAQMIPKLKRKGYSFVTVSELLGYRQVWAYELN